MANKRLSLEDVQQMKLMVQKGAAPEDIAKHFNIAISSVHNYKNRFKKEGIAFPNVRGRRPTGSVNLTNQNTIPSKITGSSVPAVDDKNQITSIHSQMNFIVNGVPVKVSSDAKNVNISKNSIEVNF